MTWCVSSPLVAPRRLHESRIFAVAIGAAHGPVAVGLSAVGVVTGGFCPAATRTAAPHLHVLVQGRVRALPVVVRGGVLVAAVAPLRCQAQLRLQLSAIPPAAILAVRAGHAVKLADGAAGRSLLRLHLEANPLPDPFALLPGRVQELL